MYNPKRIACCLIVLQFLPLMAASAQMTIEIKDYVTMPITGLADGKGNNEVLLSRVNGLREEPGGANRFFVPDLNGPLYILNKETKKLTTYLDFNAVRVMRASSTNYFLKPATAAG